MSLFGSEHWMYSSGAAGFYDTEIDGSLRFNASDSAYLSRTPSAGNRQTWTFSAWMKLGNFDNWPQSEGYIFGVANGSDNTTNFTFKQLDNGQLRVSAYSVNWRATTARFRDPSAWYHVVLACDSTQSTAQNRIRLYINGEEVTAWDINNAPSQNQNFAINMAAEHRINQHPPGYNYPWGGYMAEVNFIDGQQLAPTSFGETKSGVWIPKAYSGSYGTNGFHLEFAGNANDSSGNGNNWTANNISSYDYVPDSPTNNFITFGAIQNPTNSWSISQGNLRLQSGTSDRGCAGNGYFGGNGGKWYFEVSNVRNGSAVNYGSVGIADNDAGNSTDKSDDSIAGGLAWGAGDLYHFNKGGYITTRTTQITSGGLNFNTVGDVVMFAVDLDNGKLWYGVNGTWYNSGNPASGTNATFTGVVDKPYTTFVHAFQSGHAFTFNFGQDSSFAGVKTAQGNSDGNGIGDFYYAPPSGYLAPCTANLTVAEGVDPALDASPQDHFNAVLYSGNGGTQSITGVGFSPDLVWLKSRNHGHNPELYSTALGATIMSMTSYANSDTTRSNGLTAFNSDGFSLGNSIYTNQSGLNFVSWNWNGSASGVSNSQGSITSTVYANPDAGFSIVKYTGNGSSSATYGHGLGKTPKMVITKGVAGTNWLWAVYHEDGTGFTNYLRLNEETANTGNSNTWKSMSDTLIGIGSEGHVNYNTHQFTSYVFAEIEGYSAFGTYAGNSSTDGPFVYTGFRPAFVMYKKTNNGSGWEMRDNDRPSYNTVNLGLKANDALAEYSTGCDIDFLSNGFKLRSSDGGHNRSGDTYAYVAFAENPFKYANAR